MRNAFVPIARAHPLVWCAMAVCAVAGALFTALALLSPVTDGLEYETLINVNMFGYQIVPPYLLLLCFGSTRYSALERVRVDPARAWDANMLWLSVSAVFAIVPTLATYGIVVFSAGRHRLDQMMLVSTAAAVAQLLMELVGIGLLANLVVSCGVTWGYATAPLMIVFGLGGWLFSTWNQWVGEALFFFLEPVGDVGTLLSVKVVPFVVIVIVLASANRAMCGWVDFSLEQTGLRGLAGFVDALRGAFGGGRR